MARDARDRPSKKRRAEARLNDPTEEGDRPEGCSGELPGNGVTRVLLLACAFDLLGWFLRPGSWPALYLRNRYRHHQP